MQKFEGLLFGIQINSYESDINFCQLSHKLTNDCSGIARKFYIYFSKHTLPNSKCRIVCKIPEHGNTLYQTVNVESVV